MRGDRDGSGASARCPRSGDRSFEDLEDLLRRAQPLGAGVEVGADGPQRQVGLRGQDQHEERRLEPDVAVQQPQADRDRDEGHGDAGQQLQHQRGEEGQAEGRHGRPPVAVGHRADGLDLRLRAAEDLERRQPGHDVEEVARQPLQRAQLAVGVAAGRRPDQHHEDRDEGERHGDDDRRQPVLGGDHGQHGERHDHGQHELRQVAGEVAVEGVDTPRGQGHELAGAPATERGRGVGRDPLRQGGPQLGLDPGRAAIGGHVAVPGDRRPHHDDEEERHQRAAQLPEVLPVGRGADHDHREEPGPGHDQERGRRPEHDRQHEVPARRSAMVEQPGVHRASHATFALLIVSGLLGGWGRRQRRAT